MQSRLWTLTSVLLFFVAPPVAGDGIGTPSLDVKPNFCMDPCAIRMIIGVTRHEHDRELLVEADSGGFYRSSFVQLDGEAEPAVHMLFWKALPAGAYEVRVTLTRSTGQTVQTATDVVVIER